jgi:hypothetical protein
LKQQQPITANQPRKKAAKNKKNEQPITENQPTKLQVPNCN